MQELYKQLSNKDFLPQGRQQLTKGHKGGQDAAKQGVWGIFMKEWRSPARQDRDYLRFGDAFLRLVDTMENNGVGYKPPPRRTLPQPKPAAPPRKPTPIQRLGQAWRKLRLATGAKLDKTAIGTDRLLRKRLGLGSILAERLQIPDAKEKTDVTALAADRLKDGMLWPVMPFMFIGGSSLFFMSVAVSNGASLMSFGLPAIGFSLLTSGVGAVGYIRAQQVNATVDRVRERYNTLGRDRFESELTGLRQRHATKTVPQPTPPRLQQTAPFPAARFCVLAKRLLDAHEDSLRRNSSLSAEESFERTRKLIKFEAKLHQYTPAFFMAAGASGLMVMFNPLVMALPAAGLTYMAFRTAQEGAREGRLVDFAARCYRDHGRDGFNDLLAQAQRRRHTGMKNS